MDSASNSGSPSDLAYISPSIDPGAKSKPSGAKFWCDTCCCPLTSETVRDAHYAGLRHVKKLKQSRKEKEEEKSNSVVDATGSMSSDEIRELEEDLKKLPKDKVPRVLAIIGISRLDQNAANSPMDISNFDLSNISPHILRQLQGYTTVVLRKSKKKRKPHKKPKVGHEHLCKPIGSETDVQAESGDIAEVVGEPVMKKSRYSEDTVSSNSIPSDNQKETPPAILPNEPTSSSSSITTRVTAGVESSRDDKVGATNSISYGEIRVLEEDLQKLHKDKLPRVFAILGISRLEQSANSAISDLDLSKISPEILRELQGYTGTVLRKKKKPRKPYNKKGNKKGQDS